MKSIKIIWIAFTKLSLKEKVSAIYIFFIFFRTKLLVDNLPLKYYFNSYFDKSQFDIDSLEQYKSDFRLIYSMKKVLPWEVSCLMECMTIQKYFRRYNLNVPIHVGVDIEQRLSAHAWLGGIDCMGNFKKINI